MIRVLHVIGAMDRAGAETMIMNYYRHIDQSKIRFDFLVHTDRHCDYDDEIESLGGTIYRIPRFNGLNYFIYKKTVEEFFAHHPEIDIVHGHIGVGAPLYLEAASKNGAFTIAHAHSENFYTGFNKIAFSLATHPIRNKARVFFACSKRAGEDTFGKEVVSTDAFHLINNGVDVDAIWSASQMREEYRSRLGVSNELVFGHIGRFIDVKNHDFLIDTFAEILQQEPGARLLLIGDGPLIESIKTKTERLGIDSYVQFLGVREDIPELLSAMDCFIFPSKKEGLPVSVIEAQASGLPTLLSDGVVAEAAIAPSCKRMSLDEGARNWAKEALLSAKEPRKDPSRFLSDAGFDIVENARTLTDAYISFNAQRAMRTPSDGV